MDDLEPSSINFDVLSNSMKEEDILKVKSFRKTQEENIDSDHFYDFNVEVDRITKKSYKTQKKKISKEMDSATGMVNPFDTKISESENDEKKNLINEILIKSDNAIDRSNAKDRKKIKTRLKKLPIRDLKNIASFLDVSAQKYKESDVASKSFHKMINRRILYSNGKIKNIEDFLETTNMKVDIDDPLMEKAYRKQSLKVTEAVIEFRNIKLINNLTRSGADGSTIRKKPESKTVDL
jgi:hypothetical protein